MWYWELCGRFVSCQCDPAWVTPVPCGLHFQLHKKFWNFTVSYWCCDRHFEKTLNAWYYHYSLPRNLESASQFSSPGLALCPGPDHMLGWSPDAQYGLTLSPVHPAFCKRRVLSLADWMIKPVAARPLLFRYSKGHTCCTGIEAFQEKALRVTC